MLPSSPDRAKNPSPEIERKLQALDRLCLLLSVCALAVGCLLGVFRVDSMAILALGLAAMFQVPPLLRRSKAPLLARPTLVALLNAAIYVFATTLGKDSATHYWFLVATILPFAIFDLDERLGLLGSSSVAVAGLLFSWSTDFRFALIDPVPLPQSALSTVAFTMISTASSVSLAVIYSVARALHLRTLSLGGLLTQSTHAGGETFRTVVENITDYSVILLDTEGLIRSWNAGAQSIKGYTREDTFGRHFSIFHTPDDRDPAEANRLLVLARKKGRATGEGWRMRKSGERFLASFSITPIAGGSGEVVGFTKILRDITEQRRRTEQLALTQLIDRCLASSDTEAAVFDSLLRGITEQLGWRGGIFWKLNPETDRLEHSTRFSLEDDPKASVFSKDSAAFSFRRGEGLPGRAWESDQLSWVLNASQAQNFPRARLAQATGMMTTFAVPLASKQGFIGCLEFFTDRETIDDPKYFETIREARDRVERRLEFLKASQEQAIAAEWRRAILDAAGQAIIATDVQGAVLTFNRHAETLLGYAADEVVGKLAQDRFNASGEPFASLVSGLRGTLPFETETTYVRKDGERVLVRQSSSALYDAQGAIHGYLFIANDITDKRAAEERLKESERRLKFALEGTNDGIWDWDLEKGEMLLSSKLAATLGYPERSPLRSIDDMKAMIHPDDWPKARKSLSDHLNGLKAGHEAETRLLTGDQEWTWVLTRGRISERDPDGKPLRMTGVHIQIGQLKAIEKELKESNLRVVEETHKTEHLLRALDHSAIVAITDSEGIIRSVNDLFCELSGYSREELIGKDHRILNSGHHSREFFTEMWNTISSGRPWHGEILNRKKTGELHWLSSTIVPQIDTSGKIHEYIAIRFDITRQKEAENRLLNTANSVPVLIAHFDRNMRTLFANTAYCDWFGAEFENLNGKTLEELIGPQAFAVSKPHIERVLKGESRRFERDSIRIRDKSPRKLIVDYLPDEFRGEIQGFFSTVIDVTDLKAAEENALKEQRRAQEAAEAKSQFLAMMSHEIRTPLNAIIGMTDLTLQTDLGPEQKRYMNTVQQSGTALLALINDILDFSKIEAGKIELNQDDFSLAQVVESQAEISIGRARDKSISLVTFISPSLPRGFTGDSGRIGQVLLNLIGNAVKFTNEGGVSVRVFESNSENQAELDRARARRVRFEVQDSGIGMTPAEISRLFQPFTQATGAISKQFGGTGLGLSISKRLVEAMAGAIGVESLKGKGSTFWFEIPLPIAASADDRSGANLATVADPKRVLVIDDDSLSLRSVCAYLDSWGIPNRCTSDFDEGLSLLTDPKEERYSLALIGNGAGNRGLTLGKAINNALSPAAPKLILLADFGHDLDSDRASQGCFLQSLYKPIKQSDLFNAVASAILPQQDSARAHENRRSPDEMPYELSSYRILIADDVGANQLLASKLLESMGFRTVVVANGKEVLSLLNQSAFDLVLMDCQMPEMDGFEATAAIRAKEAQGRPRTPIVALTANAMSGDDRKCLAAGMDDYLPKPLQRDRLRRVLEKWLPRKNDAKLVDASALAQFEGFAGELIDVYLRDSVEQVAQITQSLSSGDLKEAWRVAHALKSSSLSLGARQLGALCQQIESLPEPEARRKSSELITTLQSLYQRSSNELVQIRLKYPTTGGKAA